MKHLYYILAMTIVIFHAGAQTPKAIITLNDSANGRRGELYQIKFDSRKWKTISYMTYENGKTSYFIEQFDSLENSRWKKYFPKPIYDFDIFDNGNIVVLVEGQWTQGSTPLEGTYLYTIVNNTNPSQVDTTEATLLINRKRFARLSLSKLTIKKNVIYFGGVRKDAIAAAVYKLDNVGNTVWAVNTPHFRSMEKFSFDKNHVVVNGESYQGTCQGCNMNITRLDTLDGTLVNELEYPTVIDSTLQESNSVDSSLIVTHKVMISSVPGLRIAGYVRKDYTRYDDLGWTIIGTNTSKDTLSWENKIPGKLISSVVVSTSAGFISVEDSNETDGKVKRLIKYHPNQAGRILWDKTDKKPAANQRTDGSTFFDAEGLVGLTKKGKDTLVGIAYVGKKMRVTFYDTSGTCIGKYEQDLTSILPGSNSISGIRKPSFSVGEQDTYAGTTIRNESGAQRGIAFRIDYDQAVVSTNSTIIGIVQTGLTITSSITSSTSSQTVLGITTITSFVSLNQLTTILGSGSTTSEILSIPGMSTISGNITINSTIIGIVQTGLTITSTIISSTSLQTVLGITTITSFVSLNQLTTVTSLGSISNIVSIPGMSTISGNMTITGTLQTIDPVLLFEWSIWPNPLHPEEPLHIEGIPLGTIIDIYNTMGQLLLQEIYQGPFVVKIPSSLVFIKVGDQPTLKKLIIH